MESRQQGSFEGWNKAWKDQSVESPLNPMYTEGVSTTIFQFWQKCYADDLIKLIEGKNFSSFCELGSGRGTTTMYLAKAGYTDLTMVDLATEGFAVAQKSFAHYKLKEPKMVIENVENTSFPDNRFDCIYNIGLLEHFENPRPTLAESYRLLKEGGMIFMPIVPEQPLYKSILPHLLFNPKRLAGKIVKSISAAKKQENNILRTDYNRASYIAHCKSIGYKNIKCIPYNPYWKVNNDGPFLDKFVLPLYKWHYNTFKKSKSPSLKTSSLFDLCFLLIAEK